MCGILVGFFFFFKQKTAYEISDCDWSSDVCSSDLVFKFARPSANLLLDAKRLDNYLTNIEKYQALLRGNNKSAKAAEFDDFVKNGRARQKDLESIEREKQQTQEQANPKP